MITLKDLKRILHNNEDLRVIEHFYKHCLDRGYYSSEQEIDNSLRKYYKLSYIDVNATHDDIRENLIPIIDSYCSDFGIGSRKELVDAYTNFYAEWIKGENIFEEVG